MSKLKLDFLDHVAIRVQDLELSIKWYKDVLNLEVYSESDWHGVPTMMLAGKSGLALFPRDKSIKDPINESYSHIAFNVDHENFELAQKKLTEKNINFSFEHHQVFKSIYFKDPDGHTIELTTKI